jgi:hypothetical protein
MAAPKASEKADPSRFACLICFELLVRPAVGEWWASGGASGHAVTVVKPRLACHILAIAAISCRLSRATAAAVMRVVLQPRPFSGLEGGAMGDGKGVTSDVSAPHHAHL